MRNNRWHLKFAIVLGVAILASFTPTLAGPSAPACKERSCKSSASAVYLFPVIPATPSDQQTIVQTTHQRMVAFADAVNNWEAQAAAAEAAAQRQAAEAQAQAAAASQTATAQASTTTSTPAISSASSGPAERAAAAGVPEAWIPTAVCEESGNDDPYAGFFGILEWNGFDGYPTAGSAPLSVQLAWEASIGQGPPDAPGQCHAY
jgi:hypothetical protein